MKIIKIILLMFLIISCNEMNDLPDNSKLIKSNPYNTEGLVQTIDYDSCEYILFTQSENTGFGSGLTHKGNCKYCKKRNLNKN